MLLHCAAQYHVKGRVNTAEISSLDIPFFRNFLTLLSSAIHYLAAFSVQFVAAIMQGGHTGGSHGDHGHHSLLSVHLTLGEHQGIRFVGPKMVLVDNWAQTVE